MSGLNKQSKNWRNEREFNPRMPLGHKRFSKSSLQSSISLHSINWHTCQELNPKAEVLEASRRTHRLQVYLKWL